MSRDPAMLLHLLPKHEAYRKSSSMLIHRHYWIPVVRVVLQLVLLLRCCLSQEAPFFNNTPKFANVSHRTNMCGRHRQLYLDEIALPDALRNLSLSVVLTNYSDPADQPFFSLTADDEEGGGGGGGGVINNQEQQVPLFAVILDEVARRAGFTWRNSFGVVNPINRIEDGDKTWSDLLKWEVETYDIAMGKWDRSTKRMGNEISFPEGWYDASIILIQAKQKEDTSLNVWSFLLPFKPMVWVLILVCIVASGLLYYFLERLDNDSDARHLEHAPTAAVYYSFISFAGHHDFRPQTKAARLLSVSLALWALITGAAYTANLASFLVSRRAPESVIQSIQEANLLGAPMCLQGKTALDEYVSGRYPSAILRRRDTEREVFEALIDGYCEVALVPRYSYETFRRNRAVNTDCVLDWQGRVEHYVPSGMATLVDAGSLCTSLISYVLDYYLLEMQTDGFLERAWESHLEWVGDQVCYDLVDTEASVLSPEDGEETYSLSVQEMSGIFIIHAAMSFAALLIALVQYYYNKQRQTRDSPACSARDDDDDEGSLTSRQESPSLGEVGMVEISSSGKIKSKHFQDEDRNSLMMPSSDDELFAKIRSPFAKSIHA